MADNVVLNPGLLGDTVAADDIGGVKHQRVKIQHGTTGIATDVSASNPLPVTLPNNPLPVVATSGSPLEVVNPPGGALAVVLATGIEVANDAGNPLPVTLGATVVDVDVTSPVEVVNDVGTTLDVRETFPRDFFLELARGNANGLKKVYKFGENLDIDTGTLPETVWSRGGLWAPPTAARVHEITSTDAADAAAGTGAREVTITGLDASLNEVTKAYATNGLTPVLTDPMWVIYRAVVTSAGSAKTNVGVIAFTAQVDATVTAEISAGAGSTLMAVWAVPAGHKGYGHDFSLQCWRNASASDAMVGGRIVVTLGFGTANPVRLTAYTFGASVTGGGIWREFKGYPTYEGAALVEVEITAASDSNIRVSADFTMFYEPTP